MIDLDMYRQQIIELYKHPFNFKTLEEFDCQDSQINPSCGDDLNIKVKFKGDIVEDVGIEGYGCVMCIATAAMMTEYAKGKTKDEVLNLGKPDIERLMGLPISISRVRCSTLGLDTMQSAIGKTIKQSTS